MVGVGTVPSGQRLQYAGETCSSDAVGGVVAAKDLWMQKAHMNQGSTGRDGAHEIDTARHRPPLNVPHRAQPGRHWCMSFFWSFRHGPLPLPAP
jgi:hypothetical protein